MEFRTEAVYSQTNHPLMQDRLFRNPRFFAGPEDGLTKVYVIGDHPEVAAAYQAAGVPVEWIAAVEPVPGLSKMPAPAGFQPVAAEDRNDIDIPADWADFGWPVMRRLAQALSDEPVLNKAQAIDVIEGELIARGSALVPHPDQPPAGDENQAPE